MQTPMRNTLLFIALLLAAVGALAEPPSTINIRGQLLDAQGHGLSGIRAYRVQFYDAASGGAVLGSALTGQAGVSPEGLFNIEVALPPEVLMSPQAYYELAVSSSVTPGPLTGADTFPNRVKVESVPFALESSNSLHVDVQGIGLGTVLDSEFESLSGVTSGIQDQLNAKANAADVYTKTEVEASQGAQDTAIAAKANNTDVVAKAGDTMTGALSVMNSYINLGQASEPSTTADNLYNISGSLYWNGAPAYRFPWNAVTTNTALKANNGYLVQGANLVLLTLPASEDLTPGDTIRVTCVPGSNGWKIVQNDSQKILVESLKSVDYSQGWTAQTAPGSHSWTGVTLTADGRKMAAVGYGSNIYTSADSGLTWTARDTVQNWVCVAASADGSKLGAVSNARSAKSIDWGVTWTNFSGAYGQSDLDFSANGSTFTNTDVNYIDIYPLSSWYRYFLPPSSSFPRVAMSANATNMAACARSGYLYTSTDTGHTWTSHLDDTPRQWYDIASSADGTKLAAVQFGGPIYISTDSGATWTTHESIRSWRAIASSSDGRKLVAVASTDYIYHSSDGGETWIPCATSQPWFCVNSSADGNTLIAGTASGGTGSVYTFTATNYYLTSTTAGTAGFIAGSAKSAIELQYIGNGTFLPISHEGSIDAQ